MKIIYYITLFLTITLTSCTKPDAIHVQIADRHMWAYARKAFNKHALCVYGYGGSYYGNQVHFITLEFESHRQANIAEARKLYIAIVEDFVDQINADPAIRTYLDRDLATADNVNLGIGFDEPSDAPAGSCVGYICYVHGRVIYAHTDRETGHLKKLHEEPYEEARNIVLGSPTSQEGNQGVPALENPT
jgi:hypothetical protein